MWSAVHIRRCYNDFLVSLLRRVVERIVEDGEGELCELVASFAGDPHVAAAVFADEGAFAALRAHFRQPTCSQQQFISGTRWCDAVGALADVAVGIAGVENLEAVYAVGASAGNGAAAATSHSQLVRATHQFQFARIVDGRDREGFLHRALGTAANRRGQKIGNEVGHDARRRGVHALHVALAVTLAWSVTESPLWLQRRNKASNCSRMRTWPGC